MTPLLRPAALLVLAAPLALSACSEEPALQGYIEGTYVYVSVQSAGRLIEITVESGDRVEEGTLLARLDDSEEEMAVAVAEARLAQAKAQLANLRSGKRKEEINVIEARLAEARAALELAEAEYRRQLALRENRVVPQSVVDNAKAQRDQSEANLRALESELAVARLPARPEEIEAAERNVAAEQASLALARIQLERRQLKAPEAGFVEETFYEPGEFVSTGQAIVSLLPDENRKVLFFLPEPQLAQLEIGDRIAVSCDGCPDGMEAEIDWIATEAEFTPPILYSRSSRDKLVFRVEARPLGPTSELKTGQPVDVRLLTRPESEM